ncbi:hypothetical protein ACFFSY_28085 [Paenibacillus aurantiacus]|uniref:Uncharacterized protein n=1 Tax=Paenibacillus aurantiacus TaxID=1936118 RepID=A0ABV5KZH3_9BACL
MRLAVVLCLLLLLPGLSGCTGSEPRMIVDEVKAAMADAKMPAAEILHMEPLRDGLHIFYRDEGGYVNAGFVRLSGDDWRWVIGDGGVEAETDADAGLSWMASNNRDIPANYTYGALYDPNIATVRIRKPDGSIDQTAKIVATPEGTRLWLAYHDIPIHAPIEIYGLSADGTTIYPKVPYDRP